MQTSSIIAQKKLGTSEITVPSVGFGTWNYSGGVEPLRTAIDIGAAFIDTAESYGSEEVVGEAIRRRRRQVCLASKVRPANFRKRDVIKAAEGSLRRLRTDYLDLYQLHWPNYTVPIEETMSAMEELADSGKIRFIGVSNFSISELNAAQRVLGKHKIVSNQVRYSLIERTVESGLLHHCQANGVTVIAFSPFGTTFSALSEHDPKGVLPTIAKKYGRSEAQVALNWLIVKDGVIAIPKASSPQHVADDCAACGFRLEDSDYRILTEKVVCYRRGFVERAARRLTKRVFQKFGRAV